MSAKIIGNKYSFDFTDLIGKGIQILSPHPQILKKRKLWYSLQRKEPNNKYSSRY